MPQRSRVRPGVILVVLLILAILAPIAYLAWRQSVPRVQATITAPSAIGHKPSLTVALTAARGNLTGTEVRVVQGDKPVTVYKQPSALGARAEVPVTFETAALGLREGSATIEVWSSDDFWRPLGGSERPAATMAVTIDLTPPKLEILGATRYVSPGGAALVAFRVADAARTDVTVGTRTFPSHPFGAPERQARVALIALPYDFSSRTPMAITARDEAGNVAARSVPSEFKPRAFPRDTIRVTESLLQAKVPELLPQRPPSQSLLDGFLVINREQRRQAEAEKLKVGERTAAQPLWQGAFVQPRNTKVFSNFAETRTYVHEGRQIDTQVHFGYDLASTKQSPVPAANSGVVVFTGPLTIYGNTVIIDHGLGLQTLYAHLSSIDVKVGEQVAKGRVLGRTGATGLAMGDHLHFEVLVAGVSVTPLEWWDAKWIRDRINRPLKQAGLQEIPGVGAVKLESE